MTKEPKELQERIIPKEIYSLFQLKKYSHNVSCELEL